MINYDWIQPLWAAAVAGLAAAEQDCCPFLDFRLHLDGPVLHLEVRAPSDAADLLAALFTPDRPQATPPHLAQRLQALGTTPSQAERLRLGRRPPPHPGPGAAAGRQCHRA
jgi:hypothetical protein